MAMTTVDVDPQLMQRARALTGEQSNSAVLHLALRRLIASKQKGAMLHGIMALTNFADQLDAPIARYPPNAP